MRALRKPRASASVVPRSGLPLGTPRPVVDRWRVWLPDTEQEPEHGNACVGIAIALALSLPIWLVLGLIAFVLIR